MKWLILSGSSSTLDGMSSGFQIERLLIFSELSRLVDWNNAAQSDREDFFLSSPSSLPPQTAYKNRSSVRPPHHANLGGGSGQKRARIEFKGFKRASECGLSDDEEDEIGLWWGVCKSSPSFWAALAGTLVIGVMKRLEPIRQGVDAAMLTSNPSFSFPGWQFFFS